MAWDEDVKMQTEKANKNLRVTAPENYENTKEFHILRPLCVALIQSPTENNFKKFQETLALMDQVPAHLAEYILFPFALHIKMLPKHMDRVKISLLFCTADVLNKFEVRRWEMFIEIFQRLHLAIGSAEDPTSAKPGISDDELNSIITCIFSLVKNNLPIHFEALFKETKIQILAHSIVMLLQVVNLNTKKSIRQKAIAILEIYATRCKGKENESKQFFKFLPGIVTSLRKTINVRAGRVTQDIVIDGMRLLRETVAVTVKFKDVESLEQPDLALSAVFSECSKEMVLHENFYYRKSLFEFSKTLLAVINEKMMLCQEVLLNNLLIMQSDPDDRISNPTVETVEKYKKLLKISYQDVLQSLNDAASQNISGDDTACILSLSKLSTYLTLVKFNFMEIREFLSVLFTLVSETIRTTFSLISGENTMTKVDPKLTLCSRICERLIYACDFDDILEEFDSVFSSFDGNLESNFLGCVDCFNQILLVHIKTLGNDNNTNHQRLSEFQMLQFSNYYVSIIDIQSTEVVLNALEIESPKIQSIVDRRKAFLLEGLAIMGKVSPESILPIVLYPLVEYSGLKDSLLVSEAAQKSLDFLSKPSSVSVFLSNNLSHIMNELSLRILNLSLHPNCPNALIYLAEYFDFSQLVFVNLVDQVLSRSCDILCGGGNLQHIYVKVFYSFMHSLWKHKQQNQTGDTPSTSNVPCSFLSHKNLKEKTLLQRLVEYQKSLSISEEAEANEEKELNSSSKDEELNEESNDFQTEENESTTQTLTAELNLTLKISQRVLNFLPSTERAVRLLGMDCLIKGISLLKENEDFLLPLAHTIWQNLTPRFAEKDYIVVRKSFDLLLTLCVTCGTFLKKRLFEEIFPKLSTILTSLAIESEQVKNKHRQYYTFTQGYKLQETILKGMAELCDAMNILEEELDEILTGCISYLSPQQHKNLREISKKLIDSLTSGETSQSVWMKLIFHGLRELPSTIPHESFTPIPHSLMHTRKN